ncbi:hypothetical protein QTP86_016003 [Hemibagrus guttatus]|nr:hypothetical protein QTP86_016003 [Hemibagrus guttatus]
MAYYKPPELKQEQFRRYLEKAGVLDSLTNVLVALYDETEEPSSALEYPLPPPPPPPPTHTGQGRRFIKQRLSAVDPDSSQAEVLRVELEELQQKYDLLQEENRELKNRSFDLFPVAVVHLHEAVMENSEAVMGSSDGEFRSSDGEFRSSDGEFRSSDGKQ